MKMRTLLVAAACLASVAGATLLYGGVQDQADARKAVLEQQLKEVLKTCAESAQRAFDAMAGAFDADMVTLDTFADAMRKLSEAEMALAVKPEEEIAVLQRNVERTKQTETKIKKLHDIGTRGGDAKEYFSAKRDRESAEIMLLNAQIKAKR